MADSKSDDVAFIDKHAFRILIWAIAISYGLRLISYWMTPAKEQLEDKTAEELDGTTVVLGVTSVLIELLAGLVSFTGKALALAGFVLRGRDRERRRRAERAHRQLHSSVHESLDGADR